jgi:predicted  nucleic acid-binding Zn-ribbon protein
MLDTFVRRDRRALWGTLSIAILLAIGMSLYAAAGSRERSLRQAGTEAQLAAQTQLAPMLTPEDMERPVKGDRAEVLQTQIEDEILAVGSFTSVRIYSDLGRILYDADPSVVTVRPTYVRDLVVDVANGTSTSQVREGVLQTYVPIWQEPNGHVAVVEMSQPFGPIAAEANRPWYLLAMVLGGLLAFSVMLFGLSVRAHDRVLSTAEVQLHPAFRAAEDARLRAEERATANETAFKDLQTQFRTTLDELKAMETRLQVTESQTTHSEGELGALRDQLRDTAERLHKAELDNNALRERLALRQSEFDDAKARLLQFQQAGPSEEVAELQRRVDVAERLATEMQTEVERLEAELDTTANSFHLAKLSEALREFDNDEDDLDEHPKVVFEARPAAAPGKAR